MRSGAPGSSCSRALTPIPYKIVTITSGFAGYNFWMFVGLSFIARGIRFYLLAFLLNRYGPQARAIIEERLGSGSRSAPWSSSSASWLRYTCSEAASSQFRHRIRALAGLSPCAVRGSGSSFDSGASPPRRPACCPALAAAGAVGIRRRAASPQDAAPPPAVRAAPPPRRSPACSSRSAAGSIRAPATSATTCAAPSGRWTTSATTPPPTARASPIRPPRSARARPSRQGRGGRHQERGGRRRQAADRPHDERARALRRSRRTARPTASRRPRRFAASTALPPARAWISPRPRNARPRRCSARARASARP